MCCTDGVYLDYYGLTEPPFDITPNPRFLFYSAKHREAFNHLLYGIRERKGFVQLTGEVGAGKTTLCRAMLEQLDNHYSTALILNPILSAEELVKVQLTAAGNELKGELRLFGVASGREDLKTSESAPRDDPRKLAHMLADDVYKFFTKETGPFLTHLTFVRKSGQDRDILDAGDRFCVTFASGQ